MIVLIGIVICGCAVISAVLAARRHGALAWAGQLEAFRLLLPAGLDLDAVARWLGMVASATAVPQWSARAPNVLGLEVRATARGIEHYILMPGFARTSVLQSIRAGLPGARLEPTLDYMDRPRDVCFARELSLTTTRRPLAIDRGEAVATAFLTSLQPLHGSDEAFAAYYFAGAGTPKLVRTRTSQHNHAEIQWPGWRREPDAEALRAWGAKDEEPLLLVSVRIGSASVASRQAKSITGRTAATLRGMNAPGVRIIHRLVPPSVAAGRMARRALPLREWMLLNASELASIIGVPIGESYIPGLRVGISRHLPPSPAASRSGLVLARSTYTGSSQPLRIRTEDRLRHMWLLGPTGVGKSTLIANMALQDAAAGSGFALIDPKSDLVEDILARLPDSRRDDVIVLDPTAYTKNQPVVGLNVLGQARSEHERELAADQVVYVMHSIWSESWGPRTADVLGNAVLTLTSTRAPDGSVFTLAEVAPLLEDAGFRRFVTAQAGVPLSVRPFWSAYESYSDAQRLQILGPSTNKLRALSSRSSLRLMLGQSRSIDMGDVLNRGKILLVPLSKGIVGTETAQLLGSLVVAQLVNAVFARAALPAARRRPAYIYLDEFQEVMRLATDIPDALAQARGLGVGFVLANQYMHQLSDAAKRAVLGTVRSAVVFGLQDHDDAKALERRFAPLTSNELMHVPAYEIAAQLSEANTAARPVTGMTLPLPGAERDPAELARYSAVTRGVARSEIEAALVARATPKPIQRTPSGGSAFGRRKVGDDQ